MQRALFLILVLMTPASLSADHPVPPDHSIVHVVLIVPNSTAQFDGTVPMARVGDTIVPIDSIKPVSIKIDDEFVGHAMIGNQSIVPVFVLESGFRNFTFSCDGFKTASAKLKVLGTGSKQYLIVKLLADSSKSDETPKSDAPHTSERKDQG